MSGRARRLLGRLVGPMGSGGTSGAPVAERERQPRQPATEAAERALVKEIRAQLPRSVPVHGPLVSIVILNRDGEALLRRCLPGLASTAYADVELVVVDNGSSDASLSVLEEYAPPFPVRIVRNTTNASFSEANNQALRECRGELILLLNNDIEPVDARWLGTLVETMDDPAVGAVGARLLYPRDAMGSGKWKHPPLSLQHGGVTFRMTDGVPMPVPAGAGGNPLAPWAAAVRDAPALTAACLLLRRADLERVGGLDEGFVYGMEDIDLCLALRAMSRRLVYDGRAVLWHHESATRGAEDRTVRLARIAANRALLASRWAPRLFRTVMSAALHGDTSWLADPISFRVVGAERAPALAASITSAAQSLGWSAGSPNEPSLIELIVGSVDDRRGSDDPSLRIAVYSDQSGSEAATADDPDAVMVTGDNPAKHLRAAALDAVARLRVGVLVDTEDRPADVLLPAIRRAGWSVRLRPRPAWSSPTCVRDDVAIHVGAHPDAPVSAGQLTMLWGDAGAGAPQYDVVAQADASGAGELVAAIEHLTSDRPGEVERAATV